MHEPVGSDGEMIRISHAIDEDNPIFPMQPIGGRTIIIKISHIAMRSAGDRCRRLRLGRGADQIFTAVRPGRPHDHRQTMRHKPQIFVVPITCNPGDRRHHDIGQPTQQLGQRGAMNVTDPRGMVEHRPVGLPQHPLDRRPQIRHQVGITNRVEHQIMRRQFTILIGTGIIDEPTDLGKAPPRQQMVQWNIGRRRASQHEHRRCGGWPGNRDDLLSPIRGIPMHRHRRIIRRQQRRQILMRDHLIWIERQRIATGGDRRRRIAGPRADRTQRRCRLRIAWLSRNRLHQRRNRLAGLAGLGIGRPQPDQDRRPARMRLRQHSEIGRRRLEPAERVQRRRPRDARNAIRRMPAQGGIGRGNRTGVIPRVVERLRQQCLDHR